jgi:hypothetical protein
MTPIEDDTRILQAMLQQAERLCRSGDALLVGQYQHLRARIDALLELSRTAADV